MVGFLLGHEYGIILFPISLSKNHVFKQFAFNL